MGAYNFVRASSHTTTGGMGSSSTQTTITHAVLCTTATIPGAGAYHCAQAWDAVGNNRHSALILNGDSSGTLCYRSDPSAAGGTGVLVNPNTNIIPPVDTWVILAITKATGTVAPTFYMWNSADGTWTIDTGSTTVASRAGITAANWIGSSKNVADYWDGMIAVAAAWGRVLTATEIGSLIHGRAGWWPTKYVGLGPALSNLTRSGTLRCEYSRTVVATTASGTVLVPAHPPNW